MVEILGFLGSFFLGIHSIPQAWKSFKDGHSDGLSHGLVWLWVLGEIFMILYVLSKYGLTDPWLLGIYILNLISGSVLFKFKYFPRKSKGVFGG